MNYICIRENSFDRFLSNNEDSQNEEGNTIEINLSLYINQEHYTTQAELICTNPYSGINLQLNIPTKCYKL